MLPDEPTSLMLTGGTPNTQHNQIEYWFARQHAARVTEYQNPHSTKVAEPPLNTGQSSNPTQFQTMFNTSMYTNTSLSRYSLGTEFSCSSTPPSPVTHATRVHYVLRGASFTTSLNLQFLEQ
jgi:hypothetical protein